MLNSILFLAFVSLSFAGELVVLHDSGNTLPLAPFYRMSGLEQADADSPVDARPAENLPEPSRDLLLQRRSFVHSPGLTPGVQARIPTGDAGRFLPRPLFLVGADDLSLDWLRQHHDRLVALQAVGLVVEANGEEEFSRIRQVAGSLPLAAGSGDTLAEQFGLEHYPVLIGPEWIEQ